MQIFEAMTRYLAYKAERLDQMRDMAIVTGAADALCES